MSQAFVIMQIGNAELDEVYNEAIIPAINGNSLLPKRVDKHNEGDLLKSEIIKFIEESEIIVADVTNERPNCYLEIGYAMGIDKFRNLILTAREDHNPDSSNYKKGGSKIHFDLSGYDILFWEPNNLEGFKEELGKRIARRLRIIPPTVSLIDHEWDYEWIKKPQEIATKGLMNLGYMGYYEIWFSLLGDKPEISQKKLINAADNSQIDTFGWPLGITVPTPRIASWKPKPTSDGVISEIVVNEDPRTTFHPRSYDFWFFRNNGDYYLLKNFFEDDQEMAKDKILFIDVRIKRATEILLFCSRLYNNIGIENNRNVKINHRFVGIKNRRLAYSIRPRLGRTYPISNENIIEKDLIIRLSDIDIHLVELVKELLAPLFMIFDFFEVEDSIYEEIVNKFAIGKRM